ncbi:MAG: hypothetical protein GY858_01150 [Candidatus Omnitrophica bacterium]|nr:hypothetical protein [Candidatus Omnitrophota bacterium]
MRITDFNASKKGFDLDDQELRAVYRRVFGGGDGLKVLDDLADFCGILRTNGGDDRQLCFSEGKKDLFFYIVSFLGNIEESPTSSSKDDVLNF